MVYFRRDYFDNSKTFEEFVEAAQEFFESSDAEDTYIYNSDNDIWIEKNYRYRQLHSEKYIVVDRELAKIFPTSSLEEAIDCMFSWRRA